jgi:hypothetical protein
MRFISLNAILCPNFTSQLTVKFSGDLLYAVEFFEFAEHEGHVEIIRFSQAKQEFASPLLAVNRLQSSQDSLQHFYRYFCAFEVAFKRGEGHALHVLDEGGFVLLECVEVLLETSSRLGQVTHQ